jgi:uncharacterized membrane protein (UPF0127 family)
VTVLERMRGLLGRPPLLAGEGLWIESCNLIHTVGMSYPIDLVFLNAQGCVLKSMSNVPPLRCYGAFGAKSTVELLAGALVNLQICVGDQMSWRSVT